MVELAPNSCRICLTITQTNDRKLLFSDEGALSDAGFLYEEVLSLPIAFEENTLKYICNTCDLQLNLFKEFKSKALETHLILSYQCDLSEEFLSNCFTTEYDEDIKTEIVKIEEEELFASEETSSHVREDNENTLVEAEEVEYLDEEQTLEEPNEVQDEEYLLETEEFKDDYQSTQSSEQIEVYPCCRCDETFTLKADLINHKKKKHPKTKRYVCNLCPKMMYSEEALEVHLNVHKGLPAYQCNICEKTFKQKAHYNYHMLHHRNERNIICEVCHKGFISKSDLKIHMRAHTDERRYKCDICEKTFRAHTHMVNHRYSHFEKQFECPACFQKYISPNTLRTHFKAVHMGEAPFECGFCEKKFKRKHHLHVHYKTHNKLINL